MNLKQTFRRNKFIILLLLIVFLFRIPSLFEPYWYGDEGIYLTIGQALRKGLVLYRDIFDNKPPLIYLIAAFGNGNLFWFRFSLTVSVLSTIFLFYNLSHRIFKNQGVAAKVATAIFAVLTTIPLLEGNIANAEILILLPTVLGFLLFFRLSKDDQLKTRKILLVGIVLGLGFLLKATAIFDFTVLAVWLIFFQKKNKIINFGKKEILLMTGYCLPIALISVYFSLKNSFFLFISSCFVKTAGYLGSWGTNTHFFSLISILDFDMLLKIFLVSMIMLFLWLRKKELGSSMIFLALWFIFSLFSATLSGRPYPHYLIQTIPPLSLILGLAFNKEYRKMIYVSAILIILFFLSVVYYRFWRYKTLPYYQNFVQFARGNKNKMSYFSYFSPKMPEIYSLADFVVKHSQPEDKIFIWGDEPYLYSLSHRLPATRYTVAYHIIEQDAYNEAAEQISNQKPVLVIITKNSHNFPGLKSIAEKYYFKILDLNNFTVFQRREIL